MPNVLITPHISGGFSTYNEAAFSIFYKNLQSYLAAGTVSVNQVDLNRGLLNRILNIQVAWFKVTNAVKNANVKTRHFINLLMYTQTSTKINTLEKEAIFDDIT